MKSFIKKSLALFGAVLAGVLSIASQAPAQSNAADAPAGMYRSELTGEWIPVALQNQRPVAFMVDNEKIALPHFGLTQADIVYEMMNSTKNGRITRLMAVVKDWGKITQFGSIRSVRPTNFYLAAEYNAIIVHDGGPFYINAYTSLPYIDNLSGGFARFTNGKAVEFTEYVTYGGYTNPNTGRSYAGLASRIAAKGYSTTYNQYYTGLHRPIAETEYTLDALPYAVGGTAVDLPFPHNSSKLRYNAATRTYDYYEYGKQHLDAANNNAPLTFKNVILMRCSWVQLDVNGYMVYNILGSDVGYYLTDGKAIPITWSKTTDLNPTVYTDATTGQVINLNPGKTYIAVVPDDVWTQTVLQ